MRPSRKLCSRFQAAAPAKWIIKGALGMGYLRKNIVNILLFLLWIGMSVSLVTAHDADRAPADTLVGAEPQMERG
jgi:hypothetical protein